jgi:hypothetical protein
MLKTAAFALETLKKLRSFQIRLMHKGIQQSLLILVGVDVYG